MTMDRLVTLFNRKFLCTALVCTVCPLQAQSLSDRVTGYYAETSVFSEATHTRTDTANGKESEDEVSIGVAGALGAELQSGSNFLSAFYSGTVETSQDENNESDDSSSFNGVSNYFYRNPASRLDFNAGHTVRSVRNNTGFVIDPTKYDTQNAVSAGAGLQFYPGDVSTLRLSSQAARTFEGGDREDSESLTTAAELTRRLSNQSSGSLIGRRTWSDEQNDEITLDTVQLGYLRELESGLFAVAAGGSRAEADYADGSSNESDAATGYLARTWASVETFTEFRYDRELTSTALDLAVDFPEVDDFAQESVRINELSIEDTLELRHITTQICDVCDAGALISGTIRESQRTLQTTHEYRGILDFGIRLTSLLRLGFGYSWTAEASEEADVLLDQVHRFDISVRRLLDERTFVTVQGRYSLTESRRDIPDEDQFAVRLSLTRGFGITNR
ncbi:putative porin [Marinobacter caseinilyticus]|uniref:putative porin n=1 Tax=Marinobacter caseinilyticus TaxID=2692195 RepID=UPI00140DA314|nr:putative porin [Marinobacter caseinilyticus]